MPTPTVTPGPPPAHRPDLSVVVLNWNAEKYLAACLDSLQEQGSDCSFQVIVVDNDSRLDQSVSMVQKRFPSLTLLQSGANIGFAAGNNLGWRHATARHVLFLNPDTVVEAGALKTLVTWMDAHPDVGACGPRMTYPDGELQNSSRSFPSFGAGLFRNSFLGRLWPGNPWSRAYLMENVDRTQEHQADWLSGSALMLRREAAEAVILPNGSSPGPWDESFFMYCEDIDLCYRLKEAGWPRVYVPEATVQHHIGKSSDWAQGAMIRRHHAAMLRFYMKHYAHGTGLVLAPLAALGIAVRALGAVLKLYRSYARAGRFSAMVRRRLGKE